MEILTPPAHAERSSSGYTWLSEDGILIAIGDEQQLHTLENAIENYTVNLRLAKGIRRPFLIDISKVKSMTKDARDFYAGPEPVNAITAVAIVTSSNIGKLVGNFFINLTKQTLPTKMFNDYEDAIIWLNQFK